MNNKDASLKEKLRQALTSTIKVISDNFEPTNSLDKNKNLKKNELFEIDNLDTISDFIKARADSDSAALKKKFSNQEIYTKYLPSNSSCKSLYSITEKVRYEALGCEMLKGIKKNLIENHNQIINLKKNKQIKSKEDISVTEAFELYMLKKFHNIKLNSSANDILYFWEKDFDQAILKHFQFFV